jgi:zinc/manganese transport system permease protein
MNYLALAALELTVLGLLSGLAGTVIVLRRRSFFAVALSHATFPGGVLFAILGLSVLAGQAIFAIALVLLMTLLSRVPGQGRQVVSGVVLSFGFALGALLASLAPSLTVPGTGKPVDTVGVDALLIGSPLGVSGSDVLTAAIVLVASAILLAIFGRRLVFHTFDPVGFRAAGYRAWPMELIATAVIAAAVVAAMPAVGAILGVAILIGPAASARMVAPSLGWIPPIAAVFGVAAGLLGLWGSAVFGVAAGGAVGVAVALVFLLALAARAIIKRANARRT